MEQYWLTHGNNAVSTLETKCRWNFLRRGDAMGRDKWYARLRSFRSWLRRKPGAAILKEEAFFGLLTTRLQEWLWLGIFHLYSIPFSSCSWMPDWCEKAPCTDLRSDLTLHQNSYRTTQADAYVNHTHQTSAARVVTNLIKLKHCRVKRTVSPSTPTCWRRTPSFRSRRNTISHRETQTQQTDKTRKQNHERRKKCSLCRSVLCQVKWHSSSCSLNELLTPLPWADVSTGKLNSRFPVNKPQLL